MATYIREPTFFTFHVNRIRIAFSCSDAETDEMDEELEGEPEDEDKEALGNCRIRTAISIMKPQKGGMVIDCSTDGAQLLICGNVGGGGHLH
jgi:hypothetical protein